MKSKSGKTTIWTWVKRIILGLFILQLVYIIALKWINPPVTLTQLQSLFTGNGLKRDYVSGDELSYNMKLAVVSSEDQVFPDHSGFDWKSIEKAMKYNKKKPNRIRGASTISQQVAKNVFLWQGRDWIRKGLEIYFTKMIEWIWGKERILDVYLNVIEMGKGIFGAEAAAQYYFKKPAKKLTRREAAMIAACLPNPKKYTVKPASNFVQAKSWWILQQMNNLEGDPDLQKIIAD
ncbi:monofunctional biosynthetic peptidoglycan transglycosylase [Flavisolibacter ginsengisoli]|jgi:monofunctional biosynthetic peptidoglycan transglycosylase|uniref:Biosynthetic peptidoglycan transglycosylase n=1 Tax=Flavisolibacter ginsengisoli DSM 18119 TaxID=1121884 RepID=A0A1M4XW30_9BACT|nr:monofunctional biosynthetic peptidoglycan transglycosylase [Flavisolibacter ginsengisoli]SHE97503.1 monofunctional biosynthetic peptidoglycan transglycosylase [Flavisolibacter ginsengisoli DSM 18119]